MQNNKKWSEMTPEERNALVAEKVFGRKIDRSMTWGNRWFLKRNDVPKQSGLTESIPPYTQSMDAAWLVIQRMAEQEFAELHSPFAYRLGVTFATQEGFDTFSVNLEQLASWTPEKICLAALQVLTSTDLQFQNADKGI